MDRRLDDSRQAGDIGNPMESRDSRDSREAEDSSEEFRLSDILVTLRNPGFWLITLFCVLFYSAVSPFLKFSTKLMVMKYGVDPDIAGFF
jgi:hypothetical protein